ncbi:unnamed protein product [Cylindrotheca closterium]|uniref:BTB domain-containing protein n=1 Tax=Cylindrotheca closterium TaxID=2856 RepID=A0AAD2CBB2_9STRA|nr:unnamed protein product [Cylindrotheca closterium]
MTTQETTETATFNVGGKIYKVSRATLDKFPDTMLARMASKTWQENPEAAMFIERDSERFRFCLDYMRDGKVHLSPVVSKEALLADLQCFAFEDVKESDIDWSGN